MKFHIKLLESYTHELWQVQVKPEDCQRYIRQKEYSTFCESYDWLICYAYSNYEWLKAKDEESGETYWFKVKMGTCEPIDKAIHERMLMTINPFK